MRSTVHAAILANTYDIAGALNGPCASRACAHQSQEPAHASSAQSTNQRYVVRLMRQRSVVCSTVGGGGGGQPHPATSRGVQLRVVSLNGGFKLGELKLLISEPFEVMFAW